MAPRAAAIERAACLPSSTALTVRSWPPNTQSPPAHTRSRSGASLGVDHDAAVPELDPGAFERVRRPALPDGEKQHVGVEAKHRAGRGGRALLAVAALKHHAAQGVAATFERDRARPIADHDPARLRKLAFIGARLHLLWPAPVDHGHGLGAELFDCTATSIAVMPPPITTTRRPTGNVERSLACRRAAM